MQIPMQALGIAHKIKNLFELDETKLRLLLSREELSQIRILDKEGNPFFKVMEKLTKKLKTSRILKLKTVPFSEAKPRKRQQVDRFDKGFLTQQLGIDKNWLYHSQDHDGLANM
jgi:hypothetical protein